MMDVIERHPDEWPLHLGETLSNHEWWPFHGHRFLSSGFMAEAVMTDRRADLGTALILWAEAMRQDPAGTLPQDDMQLAALARFSSVEDWLAVKGGVMHGWVPVNIKDEHNAEYITRLGHPMLERVAADMHKRKKGRDGAREAARVAVRKSRIRAKLTALRVPQYLIDDENAVMQLADFFERSDLYITDDNVRQALRDVLEFSGEVTQFPGSRSR